MADPKRDAEALMNWVLDVAQRIVSELGDFHPFGAAMLPNKEIVHLAYDGRDHPPAIEVIEMLLSGIREGPQDSDYIAGAIALSVLAVPPGWDTKTDAIAIEISHQSGYAVTVVFPYHLEQGAVVIGEAFARPNERSVF